MAKKNNDTEITEVKKKRGRPRKDDSEKIEVKPKNKTIKKEKEVKEEKSEDKKVQKEVKREKNEEVREIDKERNTKIETIEEVSKPEIKQAEKISFKTAEVVFLTIIAAFIGIFFGAYIYLRFLNDGENVIYDKDPIINEIIERYEFIKDKSFNNVSNEDLARAAIKAMLESVGDKHTSLLDPTETEDFYIRMNGSYQGLGVEIANDENYNIIVMTVFEGGPADKAGMQVGDYIIEINGENVVGNSTSVIVNKLKGTVGQKVELLVKRGEEQKNINLVTDNVVLKYVHAKTFENGNHKTGYLKIDTFATITENQFTQELKKLEESGIDSLIIDVRNNGGGYLEITKAILEQFMDSSHVLYQKQSKKQTVKVYSNGSKTKTYPIVVLCNENTASGAEILLTALKESYGATVVGADTYHKGTIQETDTLKDGSLIKITTERWLTPNGNWVEDMDKIVDIEIQLDAPCYENPSDETDNQLQTALEVIKNK